MPKDKLPSKEVGSNSDQSVQERSPEKEVSPHVEKRYQWQKIAQGPDIKGGSPTVGYRRKQIVFSDAITADLPTKALTRSILDDCGFFFFYSGILRI